MFDLEPFPGAAAGDRRRLHRVRVRVHLQRAGLAGDAALPRAAGAARLRRRRAPLPRRGDGQEGRRPAPRMPTWRRSSGRAGGLRVEPRRTAAAWWSMPCCAPRAACRTSRASASRTPASRKASDGAVLVDEHYRTSVPSIHAVGDVTARVQLTPVALGEAMVVVDHLFGPPPGKAPRAMDYEFIPTAVFTHPNVGTVGMTEAEARGGARRGRHLPQRIQGAQAHAERQQRAHADEAGRGRGDAIASSGCTWSAPRRARSCRASRSP